VLDQVSPDGNLSTSIKEVKAKQLNISTNADVGSKAETKQNVDISRQINSSTNSERQGLDTKSSEDTAADLLGHYREINVVTLGERNVESSRQIDGSANTNNEIERKGSAQVNLKNAEVDGKLGRSNEGDGLENTGRG
jgi:hypothetical protein